MSSLGDLLLAHLKPNKTEDSTNDVEPPVDPKDFPQKLEKDNIEEIQSNTSSTDDYVRELLDPDDRPRNVWHVVEGPKVNDQECERDRDRECESDSGRCHSRTREEDHVREAEPDRYSIQDREHSHEKDRDHVEDKSRDCVEDKVHTEDKDRGYRKEYKERGRKEYRNRDRREIRDRDGKNNKDRERKVYDDRDRKEYKERDHKENKDRDRIESKVRDESSSRHSSSRHRSSRRRHHYSDDEEDNSDVDRRRRRDRRVSRSRSKVPSSSRRRERSRSDSHSPTTKRNSRTILIMQLNPRADSHDLEEFFSDIGKVKEVRLIMDSKTRKHKGIAYIEFEDASSAQKAMSLNGKEFFDSNIVIQSAQTDRNNRSLGDWHSSSTSHTDNQASTSHPNSRSTLPPNCYRVYVGGLHINLTEDMLRSVFEPFGPIVRLELMRDRATNVSRGYAFITYAYIEDGQNAVQCLDGLELAGKSIRVSKSTDKNDRHMSIDGEGASSSRGG